VKRYYVYIITNHRNTVLYTGVTNDLNQRVFDHKTKLNKGFAAKYHCEKLIYFEEFGNVEQAIAREKQLKKYRRSWKEDLINEMNPDWTDLSQEWYHPKSIELAIRLNEGN
jgi:putative endonuclease